MKINQLSEPTIVESLISGGTLFPKKKLYEGLNNEHLHSVILWESAGHKLVEANLTPDQIEKVFQGVEQGATDAGGNRTMLGKGKDAAEAVNKAWEDLKTKVQNSGPIKNVDNAYDSAVAKIEAGLGGPDNAVNKAIQKYRQFAKDHPIAQAFIYSALIAAAGISGAGLGGAAVLGLLKMTDKLLQGDKFSSAAYSGAKTGAMAYGASKIGDMMKGKPDDAGQAAQAAGNIGGARGVANSAFEIFKQKVASGEITDYNSYQEGFQNAIEEAVKNMGGNVSAQSIQTARQLLQSRLGNVASQAFGQQLTSGSPQSVEMAIKALGGTVDAESMNRVYQAGATMRAAGQRSAELAAQSVGGTESTIIHGQSLTESQIMSVFYKATANQMLMEGPWDAIKGAAGQAANWAQTKGHNLTTKVTADKLKQAWTKAGSPTDSQAVSDILQQNGVSTDVVNKVYTDMKIDTSASADAGDGKIEPTMDPENKTDAPADTTSADTTKTDMPADTTKTDIPADTTTADGAPAGDAGNSPAASSGTIFDDYKKLFTMWNEYRDNDGKILPQFRGVLRDILMTALKTVEGKQVFNSAERILAEAMLNELGNRPNDSTDARVAGGVPNAVGNLKDRRKQRADTLAKNQAAAQEPAPAPSPAPAPTPSPAPAPTPSPAPAPNNDEKPAPAPMPGGSGDLWDKIVQGFYKSGRITTNPRDNIAQKIGNWATKSGGYSVGYDSKPGTGANLDGTKGDTYGGGEEQSPKQLGYGFAGGNKGKQQGPAPTPTPGETPAPSPAPAPGETPAPSPAPAPADTDKKHTGGKKKGELSNSPNAIRKRNARAAAAGKAPADAGANAFGQMAGQLGGSNTTTSSTGGTTTQTPTGQVHKANPSNPNQPQPAPASEPASEPATTPAPRQSLKQRLAAKQALKQSAEIIAEPIVESVKTTEVNSVLESFARLNKVIKKNAESKK